MQKCTSDVYACAHTVYSVCLCSRSCFGVCVRLCLCMYVCLFVSLHMCKCSGCIWLSVLFHISVQAERRHLMSRTPGAAYGGVPRGSPSSAIGVDATVARRDVQSEGWVGCYVCTWTHKVFLWLHNLFGTECTRRGDAERAKGFGNFLHFISCHHGIATSPFQKTGKYATVFKKQSFNEERLLAVAGAYFKLVIMKEENISSTLGVFSGTISRVRTCSLKIKH